MTKLTLCPMVVSMDCVSSDKEAKESLSYWYDEQFGMTYAFVIPNYTKEEYSAKVKAEKAARRKERLEQREKERQERYPHSKGAFERRKDIYEEMFVFNEL